MADRDDNRRLARVGERLRSELSEALLRAVNDPAVGRVSITGARVSADLRHARVYFVVGGDGDPAEARRGLERAAPFLQREIAPRLRLRYTPRLSFHVDESFVAGGRIDELIKEVHGEAEAQRRDESEPARLGRLISDADRVLVATHRNPDGDAIGSLLGMATMLRLMGVERVVYCPDGVPRVLRFLPGTEEVQGTLDPDHRFDLTLLLDTASDQLLPDGFPEEEVRGTLAVIDHHERHGELGDLVIRRQAPAVGEILYELARELSWPVDRDVAECLYASIVSDTGSFRYNSTTPSTHRVAAELLGLGVDPWRVATGLFESFPLRRQKLLGEIAATLEVSEDGRLATLYSDAEMLERCGAKRADLDGMINVGRSVEGVEISAMFRKQAEGRYRVSFRSKGRYDVGALAVGLGGGGHRNAAGCSVEAPDVDTAREIVRRAAREIFAAGGEAGNP
ncbi:MAG: 30S ribosome-binding factor RbfA [Deltaproteobacteria bacterium]|jgi:phosphoesterase RecJ-like protein|nr:30S ribosome-binding factor RbfA [Deltaproteobacteria bacterium]